MVDALVELKLATLPVESHQILPGYISLLPLRGERQTEKLRAAAERLMELGRMPIEQQKPFIREWPELGWDGIMLAREYLEKNRTVALLGAVNAAHASEQKSGGDE